jgi:uncharacterized membrane protein HdeD (DUF308 family)
MMNFLAIVGIVAILAGIAIVIWPVLLNIVVAIALIVTGLVALYTGFNRPRLAH